MIVELIEEGDGSYVLLEDDTKWYIEHKGLKFKRFMIPTSPIQEIVNSIKVKEALEPQEIVELSKAGLRADEIIRLRQAGVL